MKKISLIIMTALFIMTGCSDSEDPAPVTPDTPDDPVAAAPTITAPDGYDEVFLGVVGSPENGAVIRKVTVSAPGGLQELRIDKIVNGQLSAYESFDANSADTKEGHEYSLNYILNEEDAGKEVVFRATVTDLQNRTEWLNFAYIYPRLPMINSGTIVLTTDYPPDGNVNRDYFLFVDGDKVKSIDMAEMVTDDLDAQVAAVLSANDGYGLYMASPKALLETNLTVKIQQKSTTRFKEVFMTETQQNNLNVYDLLKVEEMYETAEWGSHQQRAAGLQKGKAFTFRTDDTRLGIILIEKVEINNNEFTVSMKVFISH